ncbi:MAG TPA: hypothetical protein ACFCUY_11775 [Xenococcaceae cyanobacterium]
MNTYTEYLYCFANTSLTLRVIEHLRRHYQLVLNSVAVINQLDGWLVKINLKPFIPIKSAKNLQAFLNEMGVESQPSIQVARALASLEAGESPTTVMNRYQVVIVAYGKPEKEEIEIFRQQIVSRLGYCPQNMA